jgi:Flp pilus assembly CpaE family ATPase
MLKSIIVGPDYELAKQLEQALLEVGHIGVVRKVEGYPTAVELLRILRAHAPDLIFVNTDVLRLALELAGHIEKHYPGLQVVAFNRTCEQFALLEIMRAGVREYLTFPFDRQVVTESVARLAHIAERRSPVFQSTDLLYAFLPSKAGVGTSTLALNSSLALSRMPDCESLLLDLDF